MPSLLIRSACAAKSAIVTGKVSDLDIWLLRRRLHALERIWRVKRATRCTRPQGKEAALVACLVGSEAGVCNRERNEITSAECP